MSLIVLYMLWICFIIYLIINILEFMDKSPLQMQFDEIDADHDGKIDSKQAYELMKLLGKNVYLGSVDKALRLINYNDTTAQHFTFEQFKEYFESTENEAKSAFWKLKYDILTSVHQLNASNQAKKEEHTAAPGMGGGASVQKTNEIPFEGDIEIVIGNENQIHENYIEFNLEKTNKEQSKPFLKIVFEQNSVEEAHKLQALIKQTHQNIVQFVKGDAPQYDEITESFNVITNVSGNRLNLFITTTSNMVIQIAMLLSEYYDLVLNSKITANIGFKHHFSLDIPEFLKGDSQYSFYNATTRNVHTKLTWSACNLKEALKRTLKTNNAFSQLKYDKYDISSLYLISILHTNLCEVSLKFDNSQETGNQGQIKNEALAGLSETVGMLSELKQNMGIDVLSVINAINNHVKIEASVGDWKVQLNFKIKDFNLLFKSLE